jgi:hypothetical protein
MFRLHKKKHNLKVRLKSWNKEMFGNIFSAKLKMEIEMISIQEEIELGSLNQNTQQK